MSTMRGSGNFRHIPSTKESHLQAIGKLPAAAITIIIAALVAILFMLAGVAILVRGSSRADAALPAHEPPAGASTVDHQNGLPAPDAPPGGLGRRS